MKKFLAIVLALLMTFSLMSVSAFAAGTGYTDTQGHWAEDAINRWTGYGVIEGNGDGFDPEGSLTCAQVAAILARLLKLPAAGSAGFTDVKDGAWYADAINRCAAAGILQGYNGKVNPEETISWERAAVMLGRALGMAPVENPDLTVNTTAAKAASWAQGYVAAMEQAGILTAAKGTGADMAESITRAATVAVIDAAVGTYVNQDGANVTVPQGTEGITLVVADNVTVSGDVKHLTVPASNVDVTLVGGTGAGNVTITGDNSTVTVKSTGVGKANVSGDNSKIILDGSNASSVNLAGRDSALETKNGSTVTSVTVESSAMGADVIAGTGTKIDSVSSEAQDVTVAGEGTVGGVKSSENIRVETKNTPVTSDRTIVVTDKNGQANAVTPGAAGSTTVNTDKNTTTPGGTTGGTVTPVHYHVYTIHTDNGDGTHTATCYANDASKVEEHTFDTEGVCTACGAQDKAVSLTSGGTITYYADLAEAVKAAGAGDTVTVLKDITMTETPEGLYAAVNVYADLTLDLNGHTVEAQGRRAIQVYAGTLNVTGEGTISSTHTEGDGFNKDSSVIRVGSGDASYTQIEAPTAAGIIIGENVTVSSNWCYGVGVFGSDTAETAVIKGKIIVTGVNPALSGNGRDRYTATTIELAPGSVVSAANSVAIYHPQAGTLTVNGGEIKGTGGIECKGGDTTLTFQGNPTVTATAPSTEHTGNNNGASTDGYAISIAENKNYVAGATVTIASGTYTGPIGIVTDNDVTPEQKGSIVITGGTFNSDPTVYCAPGYGATDNGNGTYTVSCIFAGGTGTENDPFLVATVEQFAAISSLFTKTSEPYYFRQTADLVVSATDVTFAGVYDGGGFKLESGRSSSAYVYLFKQPAGHVTVKNLTVNMTDTGTALFWLLDWGTGYGADFENITFTSEHELTLDNVNNFGFVTVNSPYTAGSGRVVYNFINITNNVNLQNTGTCTGVITGACPYSSVTTELNFVNCVNNGNITGTYQVGFLYGNGTYINVNYGKGEGAALKANTLIYVTGCQNNGTLASMMDGSIVAFAPQWPELNEEYQEACGGQYVSGNYLSDKTVIVNQTGTNFTINTEDTEHRYDLVLDVAAVYYTKDGSAWTDAHTAVVGTPEWSTLCEVSNGVKTLISLNVDTQATGTIKSFRAYDNRTAAKNGIIEEGFNGYNAEGYAIIEKDGVNYIVFNAAAQIYINSTVTLRVYAYSGASLVGVKNL